ncbi:phosphate uptake regulator PhoU [Candidatus Bathyarchaeota archaeon]|nr:phosphate uptake regulator PhoU [Candidatus Bathyarchaeota archaeon]
MGTLRKLQRTPSGTFFVCLPKDWAERYGLRRGAVVAVSETSDGKLLIDPEYDVAPSPRTITLKPGPFLSREIVGRYLLGFDIIRVEAKESISFDTREIVKKTVSRLIGLEIVEEDYSKIVLQCLLEPSSFPPEKILRRGYAIAAGMHRDVVNALVNGDVHMAKSVIARDEEVNRLYFLLVRILRTIIQNPSLSEKLGVQPIECLDYRLAASLVEAIGDECVRTAFKVVELKGVKLTDAFKKLIVEFHTLLFEAHENALKAFFEGDVALAEGVRNFREKLEKALTAVEKSAKEQSLEAMPHILAAVSTLHQIYAHSVDIADLVMPKKLQ